MEYSEGSPGVNIDAEFLKNIIGLIALYKNSVQTSLKYDAGLQLTEARFTHGIVTVQITVDYQALNHG